MIKQHLSIDIYMKQGIYLLLLLLTIGCSEKSDEYLLEQDRVKLNESLDAYSVSGYKFGKIAVRASIEKDTVSLEFQTFKSDFQRIYDRIGKHNLGNVENLSPIEYFSMYRDYKKMEDFIMETDEDIFPTISDVFSVMNEGGSIHKTEYLKGDEKLKTQSIEHAVLSALAVFWSELGKDVALYECSKTNAEVLPDTELKMLLQLLRGFLFFENGLYYLSEYEFTRNIAWLEKNENANLSDSRYFLNWGNVDNRTTHIGLHGLNHLLRGLNRQMMERKIDKKRALQDFEVFLQDAQEIGLDNESVWAIEVFVYLKNDEQEKAMASLSKLQKSDLMSSKEKERIDESINYLKDRKSDEVLNGVYDNYFMARVVGKYTYSVLADIDWNKVLTEKNVPHAKEMLTAANNIKSFVTKLEKYGSNEKLDETQKEIEQKGKDLWEKTKQIVK